ncbi:hypothetical protein CLAIMM_11177 [Cladophialophora immunda]|nr:hypothetical protein CLAIMM_11177 [Cladophialophora immunda]
MLVMSVCFILWTVFYSARVAFGHTYNPVARDTGAGADIDLLLYTDHACSTPSASNPNITLGLNVCADTTGLESVILNPVPCTSGNVRIWAFTDLGCRDVSAGVYRGANNNNYCYAAFQGAIAAIMLTCDTDTSEVEPSSPTSTTSVARVDEHRRKHRLINYKFTKERVEQLDLGTRIGIIIALAVGIPPILIGLYTISMKKKKNNEQVQAYPPYAHIREPHYPLHLQSNGHFMGP